MPSARKRSLREVDAENVAPPQKQEPPSLLHRIRNMWQFAAVFQFTLLFGKVLKMDDSLEIEDLEFECMSPTSTALQEIGLCFLKFLSSHRGLTLDLFDEYTRRQYLAKAPEKNPFGTEEEPLRFADFDVFTKIRVLHQMTQFIMMGSEKLREKTEEQKDMDQTTWRIEPYGWDSDDRTYFVLDDNRVYRQTEPPPPAPKPKKNSKKARASLRASKRRRVSGAASTAVEDAGDEASENEEDHAVPEDDGLGGMKWECIAVTLDEVRQFLTTIQKSKDDNEKILRKQLQDHLVPILEKQEESKKRKQQQREKELLNLEKMANAKRSSRIAGRQEHQRIEEQRREEEQKRRAEEEAARKQQLKQQKLEAERDKRLHSREKRLKEREARRLQHEEELAQLSEDGKSLADGSGRGSERRIQVEIAKRQQALKEMEEEEDDWIFDCICGVYGQIDDGTHSVSCEKCNVWQHSKCLGIDEKDAEKEDFHFICSSCRRRAQAEKEGRPKIIKIKVKRPGSSSSAAAPPAEEGESSYKTAEPAPGTAAESPSDAQISTTSKITNGVHATPSSAASNSNNVTANYHNGIKGAPHLGVPTNKAAAVGLGSNPFSSPHPQLSPPGLSPNKSKAYSSIYDQSSPVTNGSDLAQFDKGQQIQPRNGFALPTSTPAGHGTLNSPSKPVTTTKKSPPVLSFPGGIGLGLTPSSHLNGKPGTPIAAPDLTPGPSQSQSRPATASGYDERSSPLPPSRGGLSPTKHSPAIQQHQFQHANDGTLLVNGSHSFQSASSFQSAGSFQSASPKPAIPPPLALSPSPQPPILTPPVKMAEPGRAVQPVASSSSPSGQA